MTSVPELVPKLERSGMEQTEEIEKTEVAMRMEKVKTVEAEACPDHVHIENKKLLNNYTPSSMSNGVKTVVIHTRSNYL